MEQAYTELSADLPDIEFDFILLGEDDYRLKAIELLRAGAFDNNVTTFALLNVYRFLDSEGNILPDRGDDDEVIETPKPVKSSSKITAPQLRKIRNDQQSIARDSECVFNHVV